MSFSSERLLAQIPRITRYARVLARDVVRAEDLVQSVLLRAWSRRHLFDEDTDLRAWLFTMMHNEHVNQIRRAVREGASVEVSENLPAREDQFQRVLLQETNKKWRGLPHEQRVVVAAIADGASYEELAEDLDVPVGTVRSRLSRGREALRRAVDGRDSASLDDDEAALLRRWK